MSRTPHAQELTATFLPFSLCQIRQYSFLNRLIHRRQPYGLEARIGELEENLALAHSAMEEVKKKLVYGAANKPGATDFTRKRLYFSRKWYQNPCCAGFNFFES